MHLDFDPTSSPEPFIDFKDFLKLDMRIGEVLSVDDFPEARKPSYKLQIDFGAGVGIKKSSAQLTGIYTREDLIGKKVLCVVNFPPIK